MTRFINQKTGTLFKVFIIYIYIILNSPGFNFQNHKHVAQIHIEIGIRKQCISAITFIIICVPTKSPKNYRYCMYNMKNKSIQYFQFQL